jgi:protein ImuB
LLFLLRRFLGSLTARLKAMHRVARCLRLAIPLDDGRSYERTFTIPAPTSDLEVLYRILDTHLSSLRLEQCPVGLRLEIEPGEQNGSQLGLFETALRDVNGFGETLARLKALLGEDSVGVPRKLDTYRPDAFALDPMFPPHAGVLREDPPYGIPLRRYRPPGPARVETKEGIPVSVHSPVAQGPVIETAGPFRLSGDWWDTQSWRTEEWDVELDGGAMLRLSRQGVEWKVEGAYELC